MTGSERSGNPLRLESVQDITPHNKALYEAGKSLLVESVNVGREFCKFMTTTALGAIPAYLALLKLVLPKDHSIQTQSELPLLLPPLLFLAASIVFIMGYFPQEGSLSLDFPSEIERERGSTVRRRQRFAVAAFAIFCVGVTYGSWVLVSCLS